jgi:hypothetical protein
VQGESWFPIVKEGSAPGDLHEIGQVQISIGADFGEPRIHPQASYGHGTGGKWKSALNCVFYQEVDIF